MLKKNPTACCQQKLQTSVDVFNGRVQRGLWLDGQYLTKFPDDFFCHPQPFCRDLKKLRCLCRREWCHQSVVIHLIYYSVHIHPDYLLEEEVEHVCGNTRVCECVWVGAVIEPVCVYPTEMPVSDMCHGARCSPCRLRYIGKQWQIDGQDDPGHAPSAGAAAEVEVLEKVLSELWTCLKGLKVPWMNEQFCAVQTNKPVGF